MSESLHIMKTIVNKKVTKFETFFKEVNIDDVIKRIKILQKTKKDYDIAMLLNISKSNFSLKKSRKTLLGPIIQWAINDYSEEHLCAVLREMCEEAHRRLKKSETSQNRERK